MSNPIKQLRIKAGLTQEQAAARADMKQGEWSPIERRESLDGTSVGVLRRVATALGVSVKKLID
jgi:transcriptional regulator with XRE-family HTH domain